MLGGLFPGIAAMPNIHPIVVHFPIALLSAFLLISALNLLMKSDGLYASASTLLYLGTLGALAAVIAGFSAESVIPHSGDLHEILEGHEHFGIMVLAISIVLSIWRAMRGARFKKTEEVLHVIAALILVVIMGLGADLGGLMVYKHGAGVAAVPVEAGHDHGAHHADEHHTN